MPAILLQPENRSLGSSANDLSLYGGQGTPGVSIASPAQARAADAPADPESPPATVIAPSPATPGETPVSSFAAATPADPVAAQHFVSAAPAAPMSPIASEPMAFQPTSPIGAGSISPITRIADKAADVQDAHQAAIPATAPATAEALSPPSLDVAPGAVEALLSHTLQIADAPVLAPIPDLLDGIIGSNPAAGIATLVDLMKTADIFELRQAGTEIVDHGLSPVLDTLAFDITDGSPLLGDALTHHDDGLIHTLDSGHGPSLGGLI